MNKTTKVLFVISLISLVLTLVCCLMFMIYLKMGYDILSNEAFAMTRAMLIGVGAALVGLTLGIISIIAESYE